MNHRYLPIFCLILAANLSCKDGEPNDEGETSTESGTGDGDGDGDGDGAPTGDGDGSPTGDGDGDGAPGDGDGDGDGAPGDGDGHGDGDAADYTTVYSIQNGAQPLWGWVGVSDVWVTAKRYNGVWVQETPGGQYSGIWVYLGESPQFIDQLEVGDIVDVLGVAGVFNEVTEINAINGEVIRVGSLDSPMPASVVSMAELAAPWESVLVRVEGPLEVVALGEDGEFIVDDGSGSGYIDDYVFNVLDAGVEFPDFGVGATFSAVQGPLNYSGSTYKIIPRSAADLEGYQPPL